MAVPDLSLLPALNALLTEVSVVRAARKMGLSPSAMSRTLDRLRAATADPLLVRAGRGLVLTPRAEALRVQVRQVTQEALSIFQPGDDVLDPRQRRLRRNDGSQTPRRPEGRGARRAASVRAQARQGRSRAA